MSQVSEVFFSVPHAAFSGLEAPEVLDLLRSDSACLVENPPPGASLLMSVGDQGPKVGRWFSFGVPILVIGSDAEAVRTATRRHVNQRGEPRRGWREDDVVLVDDL